jgi:2-dehydropantoate 2-reductase
MGCSLHEAGSSVVFLERQDIAASLQGRGLRLRLPEREIIIPEPKIAQSIDEAMQSGPYDFGIFALKSFDTRPALLNLSPIKASLPPLICLQNGVENELVLAAELGSQRVIPGTMTSSILRHSAGDVVLERKRGMGIAENHPLSAELRVLFEKAALHPRLYRNPMDMKWSKLITNLLANATSAILDMTPAQIFAHQGLFRLELRQIKETLAVMQAQDIHVIDLPATPVRLLAFSVRHLPPGITQPFMQRSLGKGRGGKMPSLYMDLQMGRENSEVEDLNGAVVRYGKKYGIPTPANQLLYQILMQLVKKELPWEVFQHRPDRLLERLEV